MNQMQGNSTTMYMQTGNNSTPYNNGVFKPSGSTDFIPSNASQSDQ